jgi:arabinoxylan arabinofuranohydrolase
MNMKPEPARNHRKLAVPSFALLVAALVMGACTSSNSTSPSRTATGTGGETGTGTGGEPGTGTGGEAGTGTATDSTFAIDLSTVDPATAGTYDSSTKTLHVVDQVEFRFKLLKTINSGESLKVNIQGVNHGALGFRSWLVDGGNTTLSNIVKSSDLGLPSGDFSLDYTLTSTGAAAYLYFKGPVYGTNIDDITVKSITVTYSGTMAVVAPPDPFQPTTEQDPSTTDLVLTKSPSETSGILGHNPLATQDFTADPTAVEHNGRLYVYGTHDIVEFDSSGNLVPNAYNTTTLSCYSSADLVNWTDHGVIDVKKAAPWSSKSWAPTIASKVIGGATKFFLYFANGGDGIGVLTADSPVGPWTDPIGKRLISRDTPNSSATDVPWLFDPGVLVDDDGTGYLYYGGGPTPSDTTKAANPQFSRVVTLGADMTSLAGDPQTLDAPYLFEDNEINKINGSYYYSYCTHWSDPDGQASIAYMVSSSPMSGFTSQGILFKNPGTWFGNYYNNHHKLIQFNQAWYIVYHTTVLEERLYGTKQGYRSLHMDNLTVNADGTLTATGTYAGVASVATLDPFQSVGAATMAWSAGLRSVWSNGKGQMVLDSVNTGDWMGVQDVAFGTPGAQSVTISLASTTATGSVEVWIDGPSATASGTQVATIALQATAGVDTYEDLTSTLSAPVTGTHKVFFVFRGVGYRMASWQFLP